MKFANLGFKTKEGLSLAHYSDGWSMEYGEGGSYTVDVLLNGKIMARAFEEGNGGPLLVEYEVTDHKAVDRAVLDYLMRTDEDYSPNSKYEFVRKTIETGEVSDSEYACFIQSLVLEFKNRKNYKNYFEKKGYKLVALIKKINGLITYAMSPTDDEEDLTAYIKTIKGYNEKDVITFIRPDYLANSII